MVGKNPILFCFSFSAGRKGDTRGREHEGSTALQAT